MKLEIIEKLVFKNWITVVVLFIVLLLEVYYLGSLDGSLELYFLDVGQGDSSLIKSSAFNYILVDGGEGKAVLSELGEVLPPWNKRIDLLIGTHADSDHIEGLIYVLESYEVGMVLINDLDVEDANLKRIVSICEEKNIKIREINMYNTVTLGELHLDILWPPEQGLEMYEDNSKSVVLRGVYDKFSFLMTGDIETQQEKDVISGNVLIGSNILKLSHHGSKTASCDEFLREVSPDLAIISSGKDNKFGHPSIETLERLKAHKFEYFRTDKQGRITFRTDGETYTKSIER